MEKIILPENIIAMKLEIPIFDVFDIKEKDIKISNFCVNCGIKVSYGPRCCSCSKKFSLEHPSTKQIIHQKKWKNAGMNHCSELFQNLEQRTECVKLFKNGTFLRDIGDRFSCSYQTIKNILIKEMGSDAYKQIANAHIAEVHKKAIESAKKVHISGPENRFYDEYLEPIFRDCNLQRQYRLPGLNHAFDFAVVECKILLEVDGDYWHGHSGNVEIDKQRLQRDTEIDEFAKNAGWKVYRYCDDDMRKLGIIK